MLLRNQTTKMSVWLCHAHPLQTDLNNNKDFVLQAGLLWLPQYMLSPWWRASQCEADTWCRPQPPPLLAQPLPFVHVTKYGFVCVTYVLVDMPTERKIPSKTMLQVSGWPLLLVWLVYQDTNAQRFFFSCFKDGLGVVMCEAMWIYVCLSHYVHPCSECQVNKRRPGQTRFY